MSYSQARRTRRAKPAAIRTGSVALRAPDAAYLPRERKRIARLLTDVTVTRTSDTITAHARLAGGQTRTLTLPVPEPAWKIRPTKASTIAEIDQLLDHHTCAEIAAILRSRALPNGEGRQFTPTMVERVIRTY